MSPHAVAAFAPVAWLRFPHRSRYVPSTSSVQPATGITRVSTRAPAPVPAASATSQLEPDIEQLIQQQIENPIYDPRCLDNSLAPILSDLQSQSPPAFVRSSHVAASTSFAQRYAIDAIADHTEPAVAAARAYILRLYPGIDQPGGALWPSHRAVACWRDLSAFARVAAYLAIAENGLSVRGMQIMQHIYYRMNVPLDAVLTGVYCICEQLAHQAAYNYDSKASKIVRSAFDHLLNYLCAF